MIVDGKLIMDHRQVLTLDEGRIMSEAKKATILFPEEGLW